MGWSGPAPNAEGRMVGYAVSATCDERGCDEKIDRGLAYCCGGMHDGREHGCGRYFCGAHLFFNASDAQLCDACVLTYESEACICPVSEPDSFGQREMYEDENCPIHGWSEQDPPTDMEVRHGCV